MKTKTRKRKNWQQTIQYKETELREFNDNYDELVFLGSQPFIDFDGTLRFR